MTTDEPRPPGEDGQPVAGRYELGPVIGIGSSAVVRRAVDLADGEPVAVKIFHSGASAHDRRQQRAEMESLSCLDHPGLVALHDGGTTDGRPFLVTDLVEGPSLAERIKVGAVPPSQVCRIGAELAAALAHVHECGFVHRDVKPANVLLGDGTGARLADFGIARCLDGAVDTEAGSVVGTAAYLAPEQARGELVGPPTDVYALGLVLLEAVTGRREYPGKAVESAAARLNRRPVVPDDLYHGFAALLHAMTEDDPAARPTASTVASVLTPWASTLPVDVDLTAIAAGQDVPAPRHALPVGLAPEVPVADTGSRPRHALGVVHPEREVAAFAMTGGGRQAMAAPVAVATPPHHPTPSVHAPAPAVVPPPRYVPDATGTGPRHARGPGDPLPPGTDPVDAVDVAVANAITRRALPRRAIAPLAAGVLMAAGIGGALALFGPTEPTQAGPVGPPAVEAVVGPAGVHR